jgi:hypothetical protein
VDRFVSGARLEIARQSLTYCVNERPTTSFRNCPTGRSHSKSHCCEGDFYRGDTYKVARSLVRLDDFSNRGQDRIGGSRDAET